MVGDEAALYEALSPRLERIVQRDVHAPRPVIEDACQHAWAKFIQHTDTIDHTTALSWLATTAVRQAYKLTRREHRELSLEHHAEQHHEAGDPTRRADPARTAELHAELARLDALPERQRRLVWLQAVGLTYAEIAARSGDSQRTVERQLLRARQTLANTREPQPHEQPAKTARRDRARPAPHPTTPQYARPQEPQPTTVRL